MNDSEYAKRTDEIRNDLYEFFKSQGTEIVNEPQDFNGVTSCYLHKKQEAPNWNGPLNTFRLVIAPHIGLVPSDLFITCCKKALANKTYQSARKLCRTWLAEKIKCGVCHKAFGVSKNEYKDTVKNISGVLFVWITKTAVWVRVR